MIQSVLVFALGFLAAAALALMAAPALWRRAGKHERKRIEASMPLSRDELQAEIDAVRAEYAMAMRRLEMKAEAVKKKAAQDLVEINLLREQVHSLEIRCAEGDEALAGLSAERDDLAARLKEAEQEGRVQAARLREAAEKLAEREREVEELSRRYEEASLTASSRQIELVARESEIDNLNEMLGILRSQRKEADRTMREAVSEKVQSDNMLQLERERVAELEGKVERLMTELSTREDRLERQESEIARLKQKLRGTAGGRKGREPDADEERLRLEAQVAELSQKLSTLLAGADDSTPNDEPPALRKPEMERLQARLSALLRENKKLRAELAASAAAQQETGDEMLRERISNLAAEVLSMAAALQGPDSPIEKALSGLPAETGGEGKERRMSLAERVRALRKASGEAKR